MRPLLWLPLASLALLGCRPPSPQEPVSPQEPTPQAIRRPANNTEGPAVVSEDVMMGRLEQVALAYPDALIERIALSDIAFPRDPEESLALNGFTIVQITATSQNSTELPPARVYVACEGVAEDLDLPLITWRESTLAQSWAKVIGRSRYDGFYLLPLGLVAQPNCGLLIDYAKNRVGQLITVFDAGIPKDVVVMPMMGMPTEAAILGLMMREFPFEFD